MRLSDQSWSHVVVSEDYEAGRSERFEDVAVISMADVLGRLEPSGRVIVKIDAEGAECSILRETPAAAWSSVSELFVEIEPGSDCSIEDARGYLAIAGLALHRRTAPAVYQFRRAD